MSILGSDSLFEASAGVALSAHTPSGTGAKGGVWAIQTGTNDLTSRAGGGFGGAAGFTVAVQKGAAITSSGSVQAVVVPGTTADSPGVAMALAETASSLAGYYLFRDVNGSAWVLNKIGTGSSGVAQVGTVQGGAYDPTLAYTLKIVRTTNGTSSTVVATVNGGTPTTFTDTGSQAGAAFTGTLYPALFAGSAANSTWSNYVADDVDPNATVVPKDGPVVVLHGDSLTWSADTELPNNGPVSRPLVTILTTLMPRCQVSGVGHPGYRIDQILALFDDEVLPHRDASAPANFVVFEGFWNDVNAASSASLTAAQAATTILGRVASYAAKARTSGFKPIFRTPTAGSYQGNGDYQEQVRQLVLAGLLANVPGIYGDALTMEGFDDRLGSQAAANAGDAYWCADKVHFHQAGYDAIAPFTQAAVVSLSHPTAGSSGGGGGGGGTVPIRASTVRQLRVSMADDGAANEIVAAIRSAGQAAPSPQALAILRGILR